MNKLLLDLLRLLHVQTVVRPVKSETSVPLPWITCIVCGVRSSGDKVKHHSECPWAVGEELIGG